MFIKAGGTGIEEIFLKLLNSENRPVNGPEMKVLASDVARLSGLLTKGREALPVAYLRDDRLRRAYLAYFMPSNLYKIHIPLSEISLHPSKPLSKKRLRILDIGSGPGTAILGVLDFFSTQEKPPALEFTALDQVAENLRDSKVIFELFKTNYPQTATLTTTQSSMEKVSRIQGGPYDVVIFSNVLNELANADESKIPKRIDMLNTIIGGLLAEDGSCIIIEPALRPTSRDMLEVRDGLLRHGFNVYSPCLISEDCPALQNPKDWCHEDVPWEFPEIIKDLDKLTGLRKDSLKFSYLVIKKDGLSIRDIHGDGPLRVVSEMLVSKGKKEFYACGNGGRRLVTRLDKDETAGNEAVERLKKGDIVRLKGPIDEGKRLKIGKETEVVPLEERCSCQKYRAKAQVKKDLWKRLDSQN